VKDSSSIWKLIKESSPFDIILVSLIVLPLMLSGWITIFKSLGCQTQELRRVIYITIATYLIGISAMTIGKIRKNKRKQARDQIIAYLESQGYEMMSFERVRETIKVSYSDSFLDSVIETYPNTLRHATLRGEKRGVARVIVETDEEEEG
jgi:hypothetical protein